MHIRIGTRKSPLALAQANQIGQMLAAILPEISFELIHIVTSGDTFTEKPLMDIGGKGLFTKELDEAMLRDEIDIAVHSMKDVPTQLPDGLIIAAMPKREDPRDMLVGGPTNIEALPQGCSFGTSSLRRAAQLKMIRPDVEIVPLRGNIQTRLQKIEEGHAASTMLAAAGINRLGLTIQATALDTDVFLPAIAQGAIGVQCKASARDIIALLKQISDIETELCVSCERAFLRALDGSCRTPIAGYARKESDTIHFKGMVIKPDGSEHHLLEGEFTSPDEIYNAGKELQAKIGSEYILES